MLAGNLTETARQMKDSDCSSNLNTVRSEEAFPLYSHLLREHPPFIQYIQLFLIGPFQQVNYVVQNCHIGEQVRHWDKTRKDLTIKVVILIVCLLQVIFLLSSMEVLYYVYGKMKGPFIGQMKFLKTSKLCSCISFIRDNFLELDVYFEEMQVTLITQRQAYDQESLFGK